MPAPFDYILGNCKYIYDDNGELWQIKFKDQKATPRHLGSIFWVFTADILRYTPSTIEPSHTNQVEVYDATKLVGSFQCTPADCASEVAWMAKVTSHCGRIALPDKRLFNTISRLSLKVFPPKREVELACFGWGEDCHAPGFHSADISIVNGVMLRPGERTLRNGKEVKVVVPQDEYAKHLSLRHVNQKKINECVAVLLKDMCKFWDGGLPLPFLGAAFLAPFLDWKFQQKMRPYYWITGTHQSGKSHFLTYLMRLFGSGWQDTSLPGIAGTTNSWLAPGKFYRYAVCPLDDCKTSLFRNASERNAFISMLHQYTMSRGRTRSDRDGQVSEALSTGIRGTLVCTSESDISDFGSKGQEGAITSRGVRISVDRIPLEKRRMQVEALEEVSPDFSAITTDIIRFVQVTNYDLQISVAACADKLRKTLADNQVQSDVVGRQVDMWSYCLAGWKLFADWCRANSEKKHVVANTMYLECIAVACRSILAEQEDIPNEGEWHVFLRTLDRLLMENKAVILKGNDVSPGHVAAIETASPSAEVIGLLTSENLYLYPENISDQAERHYHCRLNLKMAGRELANVRVVVGKTGRSLLIRTAGRKNAAIRHKLFINNRQTAMTIWKLDLLAYRGAMETL